MKGPGMFPDEADLVESLVNEMFTEIPIARAPSRGALSSEIWPRVEPRQTQKR